MFQESLHYSRSPEVGNPIASILKINLWGIPALFGLNPVSNFKGFTIVPETQAPPCGRNPTTAFTTPSKVGPVALKPYTLSPINFAP